MSTAKIFCANCDAETEHGISIAPNGEVVFSCSAEGCGRFVKAPADLNDVQLLDFLAAHKKNNQGQRAAAAAEEKRATDRDKRIADIGKLLNPQ